MYSMAHLKKWTKKHRNVQKGDVVFVEDNNALRGHWIIGRVKECYPGRDGLVEIVKANGAKTTVSRPVQNSPVWYLLKNNSGPRSVT